MLFKAGGAVNAPGKTVVHDLRAVGREKREAKAASRFSGSTDERLELETALFESTHNGPGSLTDTPPDEDQTYTDTSSIGENLNHSGYRKLCLECSNNRRKRARSQSRTLRQITPFPIKLWMREEDLNRRLLWTKEVC